MTWATTHSGCRVDLLNPDPSEINIEDIATSLSQICRFAGHGSTFYSVAEHSVRVSRCCPPELRLNGLLHDAAEAFTNDLPSPYKHALRTLGAGEALQEIESRLMAAIGESLGIDLHHDPIVKHFDRVLLRAESELLLPEPIAGYFDLPNEKLPPIVPWSQRKAKEVFLQTFRQLTEPPPPSRRVFELVAA